MHIQEQVNYINNYGNINSKNNIDFFLDAVVIVCIAHPTEDKILLGRNKNWPARMFSCIAGNIYTYI